MYDEKMQELKEVLLDLQEQMESLQARADAEKRDLLEDEEKDIKSLMNRFEEVENDIDRRERMNAQATKLSARLGRQTDPEGPEGTEPQNKQRPVSRQQAVLDILEGL